MTSLTLARPPERRDERTFLLQRAQPAMTSLIDGAIGGAIIASVSAALGAVS